MGNPARPGFSPAEKLALTLRYLATGNSQVKLLQTTNKIWLKFEQFCRSLYPLAFGLVDLLFLVF